VDIPLPLQRDGFSFSEGSAVLCELEQKTIILDEQHAIQWAGHWLLAKHIIGKLYENKNYLRHIHIAEFMDEIGISASNFMQRFCCLPRSTRTLT
jgi:hypothetical protein